MYLLHLRKFGTVSLKHVVNDTLMLNQRDAFKHTFLLSNNMTKKLVRLPGLIALVVAAAMWS